MKIIQVASGLAHRADRRPQLSRLIRQEVGCRIEATLANNRASMAIQRRDLERSRRSNCFAVQIRLFECGSSGFRSSRIKVSDERCGQLDLLGKVIAMHLDDLPLGASVVAAQVARKEHGGVQVEPW